MKDFWDWLMCVGGIAVFCLLVVALIAGFVIIEEHLAWGLTMITGSVSIIGGTLVWLDMTYGGKK